MQTKLFIGGQFVNGEGADEEILNPATGELIGKIPSASKGQIDAAVAAASKAFLSWGRTTPGERSGLLLKLADRIEAEAESFARLESQNCGKPGNLRNGSGRVQIGCVGHRLHPDGLFAPE